MDPMDRIHKHNDVEDAEIAEAELSAHEHKGIPFDRNLEDLPDDFDLVEEAIERSEDPVSDEERDSETLTRFPDEGWKPPDHLVQWALEQGGGEPFDYKWVPLVQTGGQMKRLDPEERWKRVLSKYGAHFDPSKQLRVAKHDLWAHYYATTSLNMHDSYLKAGYKGNASSMRLCLGRVPEFHARVAWIRDQVSNRLIEKRVNVMPEEDRIPEEWRAERLVERIIENIEEAKRGSPIYRGDRIVGHKTEFRIV